MMRAFAHCECGRTSCPHPADSALVARSAATAWLLKFHFARMSHGSLVCVMCRGPFTIRVQDVESPPAAE